MLLPLQGECVQSCYSRGTASLCPGLCVIPGVPLRSAPGYVLAAPLGRTHPKFVHPTSVR